MQRCGECAGFPEASPSEIVWRTAERTAVPPPPLENDNLRNQLSEAMAAPFGKIEYLYVGTSDFERDLADYTNVLGAKGIWEPHAFGAKVASLRLCKGPQYLLADHRPAPSCLPVFEVPDLKATSN